MNIVVITQARTGSSRLPNKVLLKIQNKTLLQIHIERIKQSKLVNEIYIATTTNKADDSIINLAKNLNVKYYRGSEDDVLDRFYQTIKNKNVDFVVRLTSDCPLIDSELIDAVVDMSLKYDLDYCSNNLEEKFPDGQDIEVIKFSALEITWKLAKLASEREHVTPFIRKNCNYNGGLMFKAMNYPCEFDFNSIRMTVDEEKDFILIQKLINNLGTTKSWLDYTNYIKQNKLGIINENIVRNEGYINSIKND
jgi:spore coat polysaccharide biosynthesis protein SpsF (cytidylyltransferase family)